MSNRNLVPAKTLIFKNKLEKILNRLQNERTSLSNQTREAITAEAARLISLFFSEIKEIQFRSPDVLSGSAPDLEVYNETFRSLSEDLSILFQELENLESVVIDQFNTIATQGNRINSRVKRASGKILDLKLYMDLPIKNSIFFSDSFLDTSKIDVASKLLNADECNVNSAEGILTLPIDQEKTDTLEISLLPTINVQSNGRSGNNEETGTTRLNSSLSALTDSNADTWFEYERVMPVDDGVPLVLDLTFNVGTQSIVNFLRINPNNFGTKTEIEIVDISTSLDGKNYKSIKDEISILGLTIRDEENVFSLAPTSSKFAGQGIFTFTPRYVKYINFKFKQTSPYLIDTVQGPQLRYAIGLRDIEVTRKAFKPSGEIVSLPFSTAGESIKKIAINSTESILDISEMGSIVHQISVDDGTTWNTIKPLSSDATINTATTGVEVLNVNTEDLDSLSTANEVSQVRYKSILKRNITAFNENSIAFIEDTLDASELKVMPQVEPWSFSLSKTPIASSLVVLDTNFGSRGNPSNRLKLGHGTGNALSLSLPWDNIIIDREKQNDNRIRLVSSVRVFVGGEEWNEVSSLISSQPTDKVFVLKSDLLGSIFLSSENEGSDGFENLFVPQENSVGTAPNNITSTTDTTGTLKLYFGDGNNGRAPESGSSIEVQFTEERLFITKPDRTTKFLFDTSNDTKALSVFKKGPILRANVQLAAGSHIHKLEHRNIIIDSTHSITFTNTDGHFTDKKDFLTGQLSPAGELINTGDYSVDTARGIIYSFSLTDDTPGTVSYFYQSVRELSSNDWTVENNNGKASLTIKESGWEPSLSGNITISNGVKQIYLPHFSVVENTLQFVGADALSSATNPFLKEVEFVDGVMELSTNFRTEEEIATLIPTGSIATFTTQLKPVGGLFSISLSDETVFITSRNSLIACTTVGDYYVDVSTGTISVHTAGATIEIPGTVSYYVADPNKIDSGLFSVDYQNGVVYLQRTVSSTGLYLNYSYSQYFARYNIARKVNPVNISVNKSIVELLDGEIRTKNNLNNLSSANSFSSQTYQVNYKYVGSVRQNIKDLEPYFTPILKDYSIQVIPSILL